MKWLRGAMPAGDLTEASSSFNVRAAMGHPARRQLEQVRESAERATCDTIALDGGDRWTVHGLFFEYLQKYGAIPQDHSLLALAADVITCLRSLRRASEGMSLPVARALQSLIGELEAWLAVATPVLEKERVEAPGPMLCDLTEVDPDPEVSDVLLCEPDV